MAMMKRKWFVRLCVITTWVCLIFSVLFSTQTRQSRKVHQKILNIFSWSDVLPQEVLDDFKKTTGITVHVDYYSSNEELLIKLKNVQDSGYDLIIPSDYAVKILAKEGLIKPLNKQRLEFIEDLNPLLVGHDYDSENIYSLPLQWDVCGFGIDTEIFTEPENIPCTWDHLFKEELIHYKIAMTNDPIEAFSIASLYLFGKKEYLTQKERQQVKNLLIEQKKHVEAYAVPRADYILGSKNAAIALTLSAYILRSQEDFHFMRFVIPKNGTFLSIENVALPQTLQHEDNVYQFLNFLYQKENLAKACNAFGVFPATQSAVSLLKNEQAFLDIQKEISQEGYQLFFFKHLFPERELRLLWTEIKS